jgi:hypothetical protein
MEFVKGCWLVITWGTIKAVFLVHGLKGLKGFFVGAEGGAELVGWVFGFGLVGFVGAARFAYRGFGCGGLFWLR